MKLEIELDLNKIDYDEINKQIQEKIANMDLKESYSIDSKINSKIKEDIDKEVGSYLRSRGWNGNFNDATQRTISDEIRATINSLIKDTVENVINKIPKDELDKLISDLIPKVLVDIITNNIGSSYYSYCEQSRSTILQICEDRINCILRR